MRPAAQGAAADRQAAQAGRARREPYAPGNTRRERLDAFLASIGHPVVTRLRDSQGYVEAAASGHSLFDRQNQRAMLLREEWRPLLPFIVDAHR